MLKRNYFDILEKYITYKFERLKILLWKIMKMMPLAQVRDAEAL